MQSYNPVNIENAKLIRDGDELRNINSFEYLLNIANKIYLREPDPDNPAINMPGFSPPVSTPSFQYRVKTYEIFQEHKKFFNGHKKDGDGNTIYESRFAYGDIYTLFLHTLETVLPKIVKDYDMMFKQCLNYQHQINQNKITIDFLTRKKDSISEYITYYKKKEKQQDITKEELEELNSLRTQKDNEDKRLERLQKNIKINEKIIASINEFLDNFDHMIDSIYANPNQGLERSATMIEDAIVGVRQTSSKIESVIRDRLKGNSEGASGRLLDNINFYISYRDINYTTPQSAGSLLDAGISLVSPYFKPLKKTSMPSIRNYAYKNNEIENDSNEDESNENAHLTISYQVEYRMGTQAQYHRGQARISPIFDFWLNVQKRKRLAAEKKPGQTRITHLYINNLGLNRDSFEGAREVGMTLQLHELEKRHDNLAVITLPADKGIMDHHFLEHHQKTIAHEEALNKMLSIASGTSKEKVKDFYISDNIKKLLYGGGHPYNQVKETEELTRLLNKSFATLGLSATENLSDAELQAVYFHFIKFELTDFIIDRLQPDSFNMSCKDGIDRGGVSSAYYNLMKSIEAGHPLDKKEFIRALHGAPTMVKARGMNAHTNLIWNALDVYVYAKTPASIPAWLIDWRNQNAPPHTRQHYINKLNAFIEKQASAQQSQMKLSIFNSKIDPNSVNTAKKMLDFLRNSHGDKSTDPLITDQLLIDHAPEKKSNNSTISTISSTEWESLVSESTKWEILNEDLHDKDLIKLRAEIERDHLFNVTQNNPMERVMPAHLEISVF